MGDNDAMSKAIEIEQTEIDRRERYNGMVVDMRTHSSIREQVRSGLGALLVQGRQIWGDTIHPLSDIVPRLMVGVGDLARLLRDRPMTMERRPVNMGPDPQKLVELKKELGNVIFSTIRWIDDLGLDVLECLDLAIEAQEKFARSGRPR